MEHLPLLMGLWVFPFLIEWPPPRMSPWVLPFLVFGEFLVSFLEYPLLNPKQ